MLLCWNQIDACNRNIVMAIEIHCIIDHDRKWKAFVSGVLKEDSVKETYTKVQTGLEETKEGWV